MEDGEESRSLFFLPAGVDVSSLCAVKYTGITFVCLCVCFSSREYNKKAKEHRKNSRRTERTFEEQKEKEKSVLSFL
jgi:hypothetical protein